MPSTCHAAGQLWGYIKDLWYMKRAQPVGSTNRLLYIQNRVMCEAVIGPSLTCQMACRASVRKPWAKKVLMKEAAMPTMVKYRDTSPGCCDSRSSKQTGTDMWVFM